MSRRRPTPSSPAVRAPTPSGYVVTNDLELGPEVRPLEQNFLERVGQVRAMTVVANTNNGPLAELRGYHRADLMALAEVGYHYLMGGATDLALIIFEGLSAIAPNEAYFALGSGLAHDHEGDVEAAMRCYRIAAKIDPRDPRPDINRAELYIEARDHRSASRLLSRARTKARDSGDMELFRKATALLSRLRLPATSR